MSPAEEIDRTLGEVADRVTERVATAGWHRRPLQQWRVLALSNPVGGGVMATAEVLQTSGSVPARWPIQLAVLFGVGYEPATDLMPLLTLPAQLALTDGGSRQPLIVELDGPAGVTSVAATIGNAIVEYGTARAHGYDVERLVARLRAKQRADKLVPTVLAAAGRHAEARAALESYLASVEDDAPTRRFARQLHRWLDGEGATIPPLEQTLRGLPSEPPKPPAPSWPAARARVQQERAAWSAVRAVARGKSRPELVELLAHEYAAHGLDVPPPSTLTTRAEMMQLELRPFGRALRTIRALENIKTIAADGYNIVRNRTSPNPDWMQPPEHATYPIHTQPTRRATVSINPDAAAVLVRAAREATRRLGDTVLLSVWLTRGQHGAATVHLGRHVLGTVPADPFAAHLAAAEQLFDEAPYVGARLVPATDGSPAMLEVELPENA